LRLRAVPQPSIGFRIEWHSAGGGVIGVVFRGSKGALFDTAVRLVSVSMRHASPLTTARRSTVHSIPEKQYRSTRLWHETQLSGGTRPNARVGKKLNDPPLPRQTHHMSQRR